MSWELGLKLGKKPPLDKPALRLRSILSGTVPDHPPEAHHLNIAGWKMLGNDRWGDCVAVTYADLRRLMSRLVGAERYFTLDEVLAIYRTQNPDFDNGQDEGMYIHLLLDYLIKNGGTDGVFPIAFAKVDHKNLEEVEAAISIFGALWVGFTVQELHMSHDWPNNLPFDYHPGDVDAGGHSVVFGGFDSDRVGPGKDLKTWGQVRTFTDRGFQECVDEAWAVIWPENLGTSQFQEGISRDKLAAAFHSLTGRVLPLPPVPIDPATPADAADVEYAVAVKEYLRSRSKWSIFTPAGKLVKASRVWLGRKGL